MSKLKSSFFGMKRRLDEPRVMLSFIFIGILLFASLLFFEFRRSSQKLENEIIGYVSYKSKSIKRKLESTVVWDDLDYKSPLAKRDTIRTDAFSVVVMILTDGTEIRLDENSMVLLDIKGKNQTVELLSGSMQTNRKSTDESFLELNSGDLNLKLKEGEYSLTKKENGDIEIYISKGETILHKNKKEFSLKEAFFAFFKKSEEPEIIEAYAHLTSPDNLKFFVTDFDTLEIPFTWSTGQDTNRIQFSAKQDFSSIYREQVVTGKEFRTAFPKGSFYWRIIPVNPKEVFHVQTRKFVVLQNPAFQARYPTKETSFVLQDKSVLVNFAWDNLEDYKSYTLEISKSEAFETVDQTMDATSNILSLDFTETGVYYFRVRCIERNSDFPERISDIGNFIVKRQGDIPIPVLLSPAAGVNTDPSEKVLFGWKNDPAYKTYNLVVAENKELTQGLRKENTKNNYSIMEKFKVGIEYFWKVEGLTSDGKINSSEIRNFKTLEPANIEPTSKVEEVKPTIPANKDITQPKPPTTPGLKAPKSKKNSEVKYEED